MIQFSTQEADYLVDPFALDDLGALASLFNNPKIEKVFHAAEYDVMCLKRDYGFEFNHLFDTMIAARILNREAVGLGALLEAEFDVHLDKRHQRANWGQRPLPRHLLDYARTDTHYLIQLRNKLENELRQRNLWQLAEEDFYRVSQVNGHYSAEKSVDCWRISGAMDLTPQQAAILLELCLYRDEVARSLNRPLFKVIEDHTLMDIAWQAPESLQALSQIQGMSRGQIQRHGWQLLQAIQRGLASKPLYPPPAPRPNESYLERLDFLRRWRKDAAGKMAVNSDVVLPRDLLIALAQQNPGTPQELAQVMNSTPWRLEHFGNQILAVLGKCKRRMEQT